MLNEITHDLAIVQEANGPATYNPEALSEHWLRYFDPQTAVDEVINHVRSLPGQRDDREGHTERAYRDGLAYVINWLGGETTRELTLTPMPFRMPGRAAVKGLVSHLYRERGLSASTVNAKYLAPLRHWLRALEGQTPMPDSASEYMVIGMVRDELRQAAAVKGPAPARTSNVAALWREGTRLSEAQVNAVLRSIDRERLDGARDYALLSVAFYTGLRRAELAAITLDSIRQEDEVYTVTVIGKRANIDPVTLPLPAYTRLMAWVEAYNEVLDEDDPRRIAGDVPVWQALRRGGHRKDVGDYQFNPAGGMTDGALGNVIKRRVEGVLDVTFSAHDARRTLAANLHKKGALVNTVQKVLRHKNAAVTLQYIGEPPDYAATDASNFVAFG